VIALAPVRAAAIAVLLAGAACGGASANASAQRAPKVAASPSNPEAVTKMVQGVLAAKDAGGRDRSIALLREAIAKDNGLWEARYDLGILLAHGGSLAEAEELLISAAKFAPDAHEIAFALGEVRRRRGDNESAAEGLGEFLETHAQASDVRTLYVAALRDSGQVEKAIHEAREVLLRKPEGAQALSELALCHLAKGEKDIAQLLARQAQDTDPKSAVAHRTLGIVALANGDDALAFQSFAKASQEDPRDTTARLNMGAVLLRAGAYAKAEEQYRAIVKVSPDDIDAAVGLAASLRGQADAQHPGGLEEARALLAKALEREPHHVSAEFNLGILYTEFLKKPQEGKQFFKRFLDDAPSGHAARPEAERYIRAAKDAPAASPSDPAQKSPKSGGTK
jgi:tetratricopeptide (TPR) repeat protein